MAFVDSLAEKEHKTLRELREAERQELDAYQQVLDLTSHESISRAFESLRTCPHKEGRNVTRE